VDRFEKVFTKDGRHEDNIGNLLFVSTAQGLARPGRWFAFRILHLCVCFPCGEELIARLFSLDPWPA
jgi:hypothetical protein